MKLALILAIVAVPAVAQSIRWDGADPVAQLTAAIPAPPRALAARQTIPVAPASQTSAASALSPMDETALIRASEGFIEDWLIKADGPAAAARVSSRLTEEAFLPEFDAPWDYKGESRPVANVALVKTWADFLERTGLVLGGPGAGATLPATLTDKFVTDFLREYRADIGPSAFHLSKGLVAYRPATRQELSFSVHTSGTRFFVNDLLENGQVEFWVVVAFYQVPVDQFVHIDEVSLLWAREGSDWRLWAIDGEHIEP